MLNNIIFRITHVCRYAACGVWNRLRFELCALINFNKMCVINTPNYRSNGGLCLNRLRCFFMKECICLCVYPSIWHICGQPHVARTISRLSLLIDWGHWLQFIKQAGRRADCQTNWGIFMHASQDIYTCCLVASTYCLLPAVAGLISLASSCSVGNWLVNGPFDP